ncbi:hypothetical protein CKW47_12395, partial [Bordetella pertussis]
MRCPAFPGRFFRSSRMQISRRFPLLARRAALALCLAGAVQAHAQEAAVQRKSDYPFAATVARLQDALRAKGMTIFAVIDHQAAAKQAELDMPPTQVVVYGNPKAGTPLMLAAPDFALELPLKVLVRETASGEVLVVYHPAGTRESMLGLPAGMAQQLAGAERIVDAAVR